MCFIWGTALKMCLGCLKERMPDRGSTCLESGCYLLNYAACGQCHQLGLLEESERVREEEDEEETITFKHVCKECGHVIATHIYTFSVEEQFQEYSMQCNLCGHGQATVSILPDDPREQPFF